jgi:glycosyltransferase involved in cell wall biosynthesis
VPKLIFISYSLGKGGAAIAAYNFLTLAKGMLGYEIQSVSQDSAGLIHYLKRVVCWILGKLQKDNNPTKHSLNLFSYPPVLQIFRKEKGSMFHIHWINNDTLSIKDFKKIPAGSILTLHDEWLYCGAEHYYKTDDPILDFVGGYKREKKGLSGINWNYFIWRKKCSTLQGRKDLIFTVPSTWMLERAKRSQILKKSTVVLLPNSIDTKVFSPAANESILAFRSSLSIAENDVVISFGAIDGTKNFLKGHQILSEALGLLEKKLSSSEKKGLTFLSFGGKQKGKYLINGFPVISLGHIDSKPDLALMYSSSDVVVVPSLIESFGQVAAEALATETPVICFKVSGLLDIVEESRSGLLAEPYLASSLADQLENLIRMPRSARKTMGKNGREHVVRNFSREVIAIKYLEVLEMATRLKASKS